MPVARRASEWAVAGATTAKSAPRASSTWGTSGPSVKMSTATSWPLTAAKDWGPTKRRAEAVITTRTSAPN